MNEENRKKREWVKSAAIVFLSIMLVLTFFSNTIMNYSLPEVATQMIYSGTITAKIRGTGVVESGDPYNVEINESRKVQSVAKRAGDTVEVGDVILYLEDVESQELIDAQKVLDELEKDYDLTILAGLDLSMVNKVESGMTSSTEDYMKRLDALKRGIETVKKEVEAAENQVKENQDWVDRINMQISMSSVVNVNTVNEQKALNEAEANYQVAVDRETAAQAKYDKLIADVSGSDTADIVNAQNELKAAKDNTAYWENEIAKRNEALLAAQLKVDNAKVESEHAVNNLQAQLPTAQANVTIAQKELTQKQEKLAEKEAEYNELLALIPQEMNLVSKLQAIKEQKELIETLRSKTIGTTVTADIAGTITTVNVVAGETTTAGMPVAVIQPAGKGYTLSFSVTKEQAQRVSVGDPGELVNSWWYSDIQATVSSIRPDPSDPTKKKLLTFTLTGDVTAGQSLSLQVGQKSANYDMVVPNSAIREDNNGKFILIVEQKASPLGNRYVATRVDVEVIASDETQSAITGAVYGYESAITTATKPVEAGQLVRLPD